MGKSIGYARVSSVEQNLDLQIKALKSAGCEDIFTDKISGVKERPGLSKCLKALTAGDTLVVWRLDRLGRSMPDLISIVQNLKEREVGFKSLQDGAIDTTTASGELVFNIFASLSQFERSLIQERTQAGLKAARARGRVGGRPRVTNQDPKVRMALGMHRTGEIPINEICKSLAISKSTLYRYLRVL